MHRFAKRIHIIAKPNATLLIGGMALCSFETHADQKTHKVIGLGTAGIDYVAMLDEYPNPDDKVRVSDSFQGGGGNIANTLSTMSRLGIDCQLLTKIGQDELGDAVISELNKDEVDTSKVVRSSGTKTAHTYVIVDKKTKTRTCIHTPQQQELTDAEVKAVPIVADLVHLDSRHTLAALTLARIASARNIPVSIDAEKNRPPYFNQLLPLCDIIFTNERFPQLYAPAEGDTISHLFSTTRAKIIVTSLGVKGSILYVRSGESGLDLTPDRSSNDARLLSARMDDVCTRQGKLAVSQQHYEAYDAYLCPAWLLPPDQVVDTTGAGDSFIGGVLTGLLHGFPLDKCLQLGTLCAACKIRQPGTRKGLPTMPEIAIFLSS